MCAVCGGIDCLRVEQTAISHSHGPYWAAAHWPDVGRAEAAVAEGCCGVLGYWVPRQGTGAGRRAVGLHILPCVVQVYLHLHHYYSIPLCSTVLPGVMGREELIIALVILDNIEI